MNNLFSHSPKELTTDGFLAWLILEIKDNNNEILTFFKRLGLCSEQADKITNVEVSRQEKNTDLIVRYEVDSTSCGALFENKTYSSIHSDQLRRYKEIFPNFQHYKYLKLARVNYEEKKETRKYGYEVIDSKSLLKALDGLSLDSEILTQYKSFLVEQFVEPIAEIEYSMVSENKYHLLSNRQAQQHLIDILYQSVDGINDSIYFKSRSNVGGSAWTQLDIAHRLNAYGDISECIFWRIDKKSGDYYLRLNQYAGIDNEYKSKKKANLKKLRGVVEPLFKEYGLTISNPSNRGVKESEISIIFFKNNSLESVVDAFVPLTKKVISLYQYVEYQ
ncbi:hypothetical protein [Vibrio alginolyticus]|uniref:hypothetical protein n=1 Tax=Vibrio alginolyticus TaxID=663 RepID=UPI00211A2789|nr:hypothetical protein [Vibrio alginolyticus]EGR0269582.1 hypothetical protein [Vibrio alginolyticus]